MADSVKYFHYNFAIDLKEVKYFHSVSLDEFKQRALCVMMAASFGVVRPPKHSLSLLHERYLTLKWFAENHDDDFDLYSRVIHPKTYESFRGLSVLKKIVPTFIVEEIIRSVAARRQALFNLVNKGPIPHDQKLSFLRQYRFNIAYENTWGLPGYITEKLFDSFIACCVPVYWGDPDVAKSIPKECFIDRRDFRSHQELYRFLKSMQYPEYQKYTEAISSFVKGIDQEKFGSEANARRINDVIIKDMQCHIQPIDNQRG